jgi:hypothetical protein
VGGEHLRKSWVYAIALLVPFCAQLAAQAAQDEKPCDAKPEWILKVQQPDSGWDVTNIDRTHKIGPDKPAMTSLRGFEEVVVSEYAINRKLFPFTEVIVHPCDHSVSLSTEHLFLEHAHGYSLHGKTFALVLSGGCGRLEKGEWIAAGCITYITLTDTTGSGQFDLLRIGRFEPESVPPWVRK